MSIIKPEDLMPDIVRASLDLITDNLAACVGGVYVLLPDNTVDQVGSCVFIRFKRIEYLVTATHVLRRYEGLPLHIGCVQGSDFFAGEFKFLRDEDVLDVAIAKMPEKLKRKLIGAKYYDIDHCQHQSKDWTPDRCVIFGLPSSRNERERGERVPQTRGVFGFLTVPADKQTIRGKPKISGRTHLILDWTGKGVVTVDRVPWNPPKLNGTSGGAIFNLGYLESEDVLATLKPPMPTIEGIVSLWVDKKVVVGVRFFAMIDALNQMRAWPV